MLLNINTSSLWWKEKKRNSTAYYSSVGTSPPELDSHLNRFKSIIDCERCKKPYSGLIIAEAHFKDPYLLGGEIDVIVLVVMRLLIMYALNVVCKYGKFTIGYHLKLPIGNDVKFTIGLGIPLYDDIGYPVANKDLFALISKYVAQKAEHYESDVILGVFIRFYHMGTQEIQEVSLSSEALSRRISELMNAGIGSPPIVEAMDRRVRHPNYISVLKSRTKERRGFIVADTETVLLNEIHVPYAAGFLVVNPDDDVGRKRDSEIETYFSEDHLVYLPEFVDRSNRMLFLFLERLAKVAASREIRTVYFHNFSRFDGILLMKYYVSHGKKYTFKSLIRNNTLYEFKVFFRNKLVFRIRDSCLILSGTLDKLAETLCPELGRKGSIPYEEVVVSTLESLRVVLLDYMKQDIRLLGGVLLKAQELFWTQYKVDIENCMTLSKLSMTIFRMSYYDPKTFPIHIPNKNEDRFIRRGYYGGRTDVFKPQGRDLSHYDVNSLYPFIMKMCPMPSGVPVWHSHLEGEELSTLYGFIEAYVVCPRTLKIPFLPKKDKNESLLFPTGKFVGVYFSEELIFARSLGYKIIPMRGYLFEKKSSPFEGFISSLFQKRLEAKKTENHAMDFCYKIIMNSLYGRFGIKPKSTMSKLCQRDIYESMIVQDSFISACQLSDLYYMVNYSSNTENVDDSEWQPPKISAVHISAAITACARIYMYPYISRPDCFYTDTDSVILGSKLSEEDISSTELGKFKLECHAKEGIFVAPKSYCLTLSNDLEKVTHKGAAKPYVDGEWFKKLIANPSISKMVPTESIFYINRESLTIGIQKRLLNLNIKIGTKRDPVFDENNSFVDTLPKEVIDFGGQENRIIHLEMEMNQKLFKKKEIEYATLQKEYTTQQKEKDLTIATLESELAKLREENQSLSANLPEKPVTQQESTIEQPTLYNYPKKRKWKEKEKGTKETGKNKKTKEPP